MSERRPERLSSSHIVEQESEYLGCINKYRTDFIFSNLRFTVSSEMKKRIS